MGQEEHGRLRAVGNPCPEAPWMVPCRDWQAERAACFAHGGREAARRTYPSLELQRQVGVGAVGLVLALGPLRRCRRRRGQRWVLPTVCFVSGRELGRTR